MPKLPDEELKKAFSELHDKSVETKHRIKIIDLQIESLRRSKQRAELTQIEMRTLPSNVKTYETVGRMFLQQDINTIKVDLKKRMKMADEKIKNLENSKAHLQYSLKESENNLREMVQRRQQEANDG